MQLADESQLYYPDFLGQLTVEQFLVSLVRKLTEVQEDRTINPDGKSIVSNFNVDEIAETITFSIENIYGLYKGVGFQVVEPFTNSFTTGLKAWPFDARGLAQAIVNLITFMSYLELEESLEPAINFSIESGERDTLASFGADVNLELQWLDRSTGANTCKEYLKVGETI